MKDHGILMENAKFFPIGRKWKLLRSIYYSEHAASIWQPCMKEYCESRSKHHKYEYTHKNHPSPAYYDSCDWRCERRGKAPEFWEFVCHSACHWLVDLNLFVAKTFDPITPWSIITGKRHSTVWNKSKENPILFDANFLALKVCATDAMEMALTGRILRPSNYLKWYLHP